MFGSHWLDIWILVEGKDIHGAKLVNVLQVEFMLSLCQSGFEGRL